MAIQELQVAPAAGAVSECQGVLCRVGGGEGAPDGERVGRGGDVRGGREGPAVQGQGGV